MIRYPPGQFILLEGPDLAGKSTLFHELVRILTPESGHGKRQVSTSEPTGGKHGRDALAATDPTERAKHFTADRHEHVSHLLKPYLSTLLTAL
ncbi:MAG: hypothetical protein EOM17_14950 [Synergistales bacterium]|nr:hypothetical protein [Synergistales bacterium]